MNFIKTLKSDFNAGNVLDGPRRIFHATNSYRDELRFFHVESTYYEWTLEERAKRLGAPSIDHLCKSLLFKNTKWKPRNEDDTPLNRQHPQYVLVVVQYTDKISSKKLNTAIKTGAGNVQGLKCFNMRVAHEEEAIRFQVFI